MNEAKGQFFVLKGKITTDSSRKLEDCYIKISSESSGNILSYFNTGIKDSFMVKVPLKKPDTLLITVSHIGYRNSVVRHFFKIGDTSNVDITMSLLTDTLKDVVIKGPSMWVRGDTTFFSAEAFKSGVETKLKDLVIRMPGFEIDDKGNLLYKKKLVDKIMIDGEEIFSDKIKLLLANFPVHVLKTVQAIENQTDDRLLKGMLNENKVFVNLGLNKERFNTVFGDGEAGVGTGKKYSFNPVIFSMYGKTKLGYIGNWDNIGNGIGWQEQAELKNDPIKMAERWMMSTDQLQIINNFENRRYITNGRFANHLQLNSSTKRSLKNKTEFNLLKDHQSQATIHNSNLYDGENFIQRIDTNYIRNNPYLFTIKHTIEWDIDSTRQLDANLLFYHNGNISSKDARYASQEWFDNNAGALLKTSFLFVDAEYNLSIPQKHLSFILSFQNFTNARFYKSWNSNPLIQDFFTIPLVARNAFLSVRYEL